MTRFSLVCPFYNVEPYVDAFMGSVVSQTFDSSRVQIILVDDGSTDGTGALIDRWCSEHPGRFEVIRQSNGGLSRARNAGLERCVGEWVMFPDSDDRLADDYLTRLDEFCTREQTENVDVIATRRVIRDEARGVLKDTHPLRGVFEAGDRVVPMTATTREFVLAVNSGAVRRSALEETGLRFDPAVRPTFEDALLLGQLLLARGTALGICASATYEWTRRAAADSTTQVAWRRPERYDHVFRVGYLRLLDDAIARLGSVPDWAARMVLYDLQWYLRIDRKDPSPMRELDEAVLRRLEEHFVAALSRMKPEQIAGFELCQDDRVLTALRSFVQPRVHSRPEIIDVRGDRLTIAYEYMGERPIEQMREDVGLRAEYREELEVLVFGRPRLRRRIISCELPPGSRGLLLTLDGQEHRVVRPETRTGRSIRSIAARLLRRARRPPEHGQPSSR